MTINSNEGLPYQNISILRACFHFSVCSIGNYLGTEAIVKAWRGEGDGER